MPAAQTVQFVAPAAEKEPAAQVAQPEAPAAAEYEPAEQFAQTVFEVGEQAAARKVPAAHTLDEQFAQGAQPGADQVLPATQEGSARHESEGASHA